MNISVNFMSIVLLIFTIAPTILAVFLARKQNRSMWIAGLVTFFLGLFTWIGSWIYLGLMNLMSSKQAAAE
mgnify:CR=1 FL=1|tara:strand:- start:784 stop:996 length:213 start_codon:yes stop_codon:yes gene_type:complete